jgi:hypothetical protein
MTEQLTIVIQEEADSIGLGWAAFRDIVFRSPPNANVIGSIKEEQSRKMTTSTISRGNHAPLESFLAGAVGDLLVPVQCCSR